MHCHPPIAVANFCPTQSHDPPSPRPPHNHHRRQKQRQHRHHHHHHHHHQHATTTATASTTTTTSGLESLAWNGDFRDLGVGALGLSLKYWCLIFVV